MSDSLRAIWYYFLLISYFCIYNTVSEVVWFVESFVRRYTEFKPNLYGFLPYIYAHSSLLTYKLAGINVHVNGSVTKRRTLWLSNHRSVLDGIMISSMIYRAGNSIVVLTKNSIKYIPVIGPFCYNCCHLIFVKRQSTERSANLKMLEADVRNTIASNHSILCFPEGTTLSPESQLRSDLFIKKNGLPIQLRNVILPKATGFDIIQETGNFPESVGNITVSYPELIGTERHIFTDFFSVLPTKACIDISYGNIAADDLIGVFQEKDSVLEADLPIKAAPESLAIGWTLVNTLTLISAYSMLYMYPATLYVFYATTLTSYVRMFW